MSCKGNGTRQIRYTPVPIWHIDRRDRCTMTGFFNWHRCCQYVEYEPRHTVVCCPPIAPDNASSHRGVINSSHSRTGSHLTRHPLAGFFCRSRTRPLAKSRDRADVGCAATDLSHIERSRRQARSTMPQPGVSLHWQASRQMPLPHPLAAAARCIIPLINHSLPPDSTPPHATASVAVKQTPVLAWNMPLIVY